MSRYKTDIEIIMKDNLLSNKIDFVEEFPIRGRFGYILDFAIPELKIDVECDGCRWHPKGNKHDRNRNWVLINRGWVILRFTDTQIKNDINNCIAKINETIERRKLENENTS